MSAANPRQAFEVLGLPNLQKPSPNLITGGAPDEATLRAAADAGIHYVFDLRPESEWSFDEPALVLQLGMRFLHLPIAGGQDLTLDNTRAFDSMLTEIGDQPTLLHCASGNRVGALFALRAAWLKQLPQEEALAIGRAHGLTRMEGPVQALLARGPD